MPISDAECKLLAAEIAHIKSAVDEIKSRLDANFVTKAEFAPVARIVYGLIALMALAVGGAIVKLVLK